MSASAYLRYKQSGADWLGAVPEHWKVIRLKGAATYRVSSVDKVPSEDELPVRLCNYKDVYYNERIHPRLPLMETTATANEIERFHLNIGDVLITKDSEDWADIAVPALVEETAPDLVCGYHLAIVRPRESALHGPFLLRAMQASAINQQFQLASSGVTRYGLPKSAIGDALLALPPVEEQRHIAAFLDAETAKLNALIEKKRTLIELLKEQRSALISRTVTRGLPPDAARTAGLAPHPEMKDSGIPSFARIPRTWHIRPLMRLTDSARPIMYGIVLPGPNVEEGVLIVKGGDVKPGRLRADSLNKTTPEIEASYVRSRLKESDIVFSIRGSIGDAELVPKEIEGANLTQDAARIAPGKQVSVEWLLYALKAEAIIGPLLALSLGAAVRGVNIRDLKRVRIPVPPLDEQMAISNFLDMETTKITSITSKLEDAIERLREYRSALITAAVTGKFDVRQAIA